MIEEEREKKGGKEVRERRSREGVDRKSGEEKRVRIEEKEEEKK